MKKHTYLLTAIALMNIESGILSAAEQSFDNRIQQNLFKQFRDYLNENPPNIKGLETIIANPDFNPNITRPLPRMDFPLSSLLARLNTGGPELGPMLTPIAKLLLNHDKTDPNKKGGHLCSVLLYYQNRSSNDSKVS